MKNYFRHTKGFTLIEVIIVIVIMAVLASVAMKSIQPVVESSRVEETKAELDQLAIAIVGNPQLQNNGVRTDFGYVGDVGSLPADLNALISDPGGYSTWDGPYLQSDFSQATNEFKQDAWNKDYTYSGIDLTSTGSGSNIIRKLGNSTNDFTTNTIRGNILDLNNTPPGLLFVDSLSVQLSYPDGTGGISNATASISSDGYFIFPSIPIGNHDLSVVYQPTNDSLVSFVSVLPSSDQNSIFKFDTAYFGSSGSGGGGGSGIEYVSGTATVSGGGCNDIGFDLINNTGSAITFSSWTMSWSTPTAYYKKIELDGNTLFDSANPRAASGELVTFGAPQTINPGQTVSLTSFGFKENVTGGANVNMSNVDIMITFSDGSVITFNTGGC